jgi:uncharacterized DUF497 family protein
MEYAWHDAKHERNIREHGIGFEVAALIFLGQVVLQQDIRHDYGEVRMKAIGAFDGDVLVVMYGDRGDQRWIILVPRANRRERTQWQS